MNEGRGRTPTDRNEHCILKDSGATIACTHCGVEIGVRLPMVVAEYAAVILGFTDRHKHCEPHDNPLTDEIKSA